MDTELVTYKEKNVQMSMLEVISMIVIIFGIMYGIGYLNFLYDSSLYPWYVDYLIPPLTFLTIILIYSPARNYCVHLLKSIQFNNSKHYVTIIMTMIVLLIYLAVLNLVLPHGLRVEESNIVIEPTKNEIILYVVVLTIFAPIWEELVFRGMFFMKLSQRFSTLSSAVISAFIFTLGHPLTLGSVLYILGGGICLAYTYKKTNNLLVPWGIHVLNNSFYLLLNFQL
ncbi:TPA: CPBP family intramembrane glutamic endopeptidase [Bacillus cereus]|uniref:CPBP family intramembrane glutamic endopeptidase n=1 Tax=Bacillus cereus group TaxID=86661 RepID=UPI00016B3188|nr:MULTISPECIES: type II CAAX endopeptidase family protein [Bacillus cereus group]EDX58442.1 CAAX amino terminal protease family protein [Bacillus cereus W]MCU5693395.1 CPBP family intramembrane metalloprotease [Bacillus cereus]MEB9525593.1 type II CAAX endopeptidase family protein [Bacillus anthracis]MEC0042022.1 type II CAAX endopeptidase family protein [Bacillus anthracis]TBX84446.1 CPBP family intramembrane metalloprotease [Bacillus cereus]